MLFKLPTFSMNYLFIAYIDAKYVKIVLKSVKSKSPDNNNTKKMKKTSESLLKWDWI